VRDSDLFFYDRRATYIATDTCSQQLPFVASSSCSIRGPKSVRALTPHFSRLCPPVRGLLRRTELHYLASGRAPGRISFPVTGTLMGEVYSWRRSSEPKTRGSWLLDSREPLHLTEHDSCQTLSRRPPDRVSQAHLFETFHLYIYRWTGCRAHTNLSPPKCRDQWRHAV
jgi:hypothetical protein